MIKRIKKATVRMELGKFHNKYNLHAEIEDGVLNSLSMNEDETVLDFLQTRLTAILQCDLSHFLEFIKEIKIAIDETGEK